MKRDDILLIVSFLIFVLSAICLIDSYNSLVIFSDSITGYISHSGSIGLSVTDYELVNFTSTNLINFGAGAVFEDEDSATLDTVGGIYNGTWSAVSGGFVLKNLGNVNVTLNFSTGKDADTFIGGSNPFYQYNISNIEDGGCVPPLGFDLNIFHDASINTVEVCDYLIPNASINIDFRLVIPHDSNLGNLTDSVFILHEASL